MYAGVLATRVVDLIEGAAMPHLDQVSVLGAIALVAAAAGLVTVQNFALGGWEPVPLLVAEPFPRVEASIGVVPAMSGVDDALIVRWRRYAQHPSVDALVVVTPDADGGLLPRTIGDVPVRAAILSRS